MKLLKLIAENYNEILILLPVVVFGSFVVAGLCGVFDNNTQQETIDVFTSYIDSKLTN